MFDIKHLNNNSVFFTIHRSSSFSEDKYMVWVLTWVNMVFLLDKTVYPFLQKIYEGHRYDHEKYCLRLEYIKKKYC